MTEKATATRLNLTESQFAFLANLRRAPQPAVQRLDASMVGPLIRANLVRWDEEPGRPARRHQLPSSVFSLTDLGKARLVAHEAS